MLILRHIYIEIALLQLKTDRQIFTFEGEIERLSPGDLFIGQIFAAISDGKYTVAIHLKTGRITLFI